ncbi:ExbD/TolR family protein [Celeribacter marinus]|uniref:ExbD/TolR family protein n=1 Tax=Celeribacter marinus TaxID=1397108 RepID=UPI003F6C5B8E
MFAFGADRPRRRPNLTPMIDVVFLLLVFFMLVSRFGADVSISIRPSGDAASAEWIGPPRVIDVYGSGRVDLNGEPSEVEHLAGWLKPLMPTDEAAVVIRTHDADLSQLTEVLDLLTRKGITNLIVME